MDKKIIQHFNQVNETLTSKDDIDARFWRDFLNFHQQKIQNFQHERLIHLLVTIFWTLLTIMFGLLAVLVSSTFDSGEMFTVQVMLYAIFVIFFILPIINSFHLRIFVILINKISIIWWICFCFLTKWMLQNSNTKYYKKVYFKFHNNLFKCFLVQ